MEYEGVTFAADKYAVGGTTNSTSDPIAGTSGSDALYQTERYGSYSYRVPVLDGSYTVDLHFVELYWEANGERSFSVTIEGDTVLADLDLHSQAGHDGAFRYVVEDKQVTDGYLDIELDATVDNGTLSGYAIYSGNGGLDPEGEVVGNPSQLDIGSFGLAAGETKFLGNIWNYRDLNNAGRQNTFRSLFNQMTLENDAKWDAIEPTRDGLRLGAGDPVPQAYNWAKQNDVLYRHHVFVWGSQEPSWIGNLSQAEQRAEVEEHIREVCRVLPDIDMIDVVNEPLHAPASYRNALGGAGSTGWDWIVQSFEWARQYCPNSMLGLNDYGIVDNPQSLSTYMQIVNILNDRGLIDSVGVQAHHFSLRNMTAATLKSRLDQLGAPGLPVFIEEMDVEDNQGLQKYTELFPVMWEHPAVLGVTIWGLRKNETWRQEHQMGLLYQDGSDAPEMQFLKQYFNNR